ncbi:C-type lectin mannose-binding isoform-like [Haliotis rubra]|uniref:C-type lectin mannose-binding isoform-like n=1 Tax=Haliotis rubra TaxID=36100 RepID=UPI001EE62B49|nr:C-type lectin mannose-binding isoform-like [Haliotis rubra]
MSNVRDDVDWGTGNPGEGWMNNLRDDVNRRTGNAREEWMSNVRDDVYRRTGIAGEEWTRNDVNWRTGNAGEGWMNNLRDDVYGRTGNGRRNRHSTEFNTNPRQESSCPRDFVYNAKLKFCFKVIFERSPTFSAKKKCQQMVKGGRLVQPDTSDKLRELTKYISSNKREARSSFAFGSIKRRRQWHTWMDGSPMDYTNWCDGSPKHGKHCVTLISQQWGSDMCMDDGDCLEHVNFICEKPVEWY